VRAIAVQVALECSSLRPLLLQQPPLPTWSVLALFLAELKHWGDGADSSSRGEGPSGQESKAAKESESSRTSHSSSTSAATGEGRTHSSNSVGSGGGAAAAVGDGMHSAASPNSTMPMGCSSSGVGLYKAPPAMTKWLPYLEALPSVPGTVLDWPRQQVGAWECCHLRQKLLKWL